MMKRKTLMQKLSDKGVHVVGTTEDFYGYESGDGIWISAESTTHIFDYWSTKWADTFGVDPKLNSFVEKNGWFFEWYDPGTMMVWPN